MSVHTRIYSVYTPEYIGSLRVCAGAETKRLVQQLVQLVLVNLKLCASLASYPLFGFWLLAETASSFQLRRRDWWLTGLFPRVVYCDADIRVLANTQRHTFQCVHTDLSCHAYFHESAVKPFVN